MSRLGLGVGLDHGSGAPAHGGLFVGASHGVASKTAALGVNKSLIGASAGAASQTSDLTVSNNSLPDIPVTSGLQVWYRADKGANTNSLWKDQSGNANDANTSQGSFSSTAGTLGATAWTPNGGPAYTFSSVQGLVTGTIAINTGAFTVMMVCEASGAVGYPWCISSVLPYIYVWGGTVGQGDHAFTDQAASTSTIANASGASWLEDSTAHMIIFASDGTSANTIGSSDGSGVAGVSFSGNVGNHAISAQMAINAVPSLSAPGCGTVVIRELAVYNRLLNSTELGQLHTYSQSVNGTP